MITDDFTAEIAHHFAHSDKNDPEHTLMIQAGAKDMWHLALGLYLLFDKFPCLEESTLDLQQRIVELLKHQDPFIGQEDRGQAE